MRIIRAAFHSSIVSAICLFAHCMVVAQQNRVTDVHDEDRSEIRPVTIQDSVTLRTFEDQLAISPDGSKIAYFLLETNLEKNENNLVLCVLQLAQAKSTKNSLAGCREVFRTAPMRQLDKFFHRSNTIRWLADNQTVLVLSQPSQERFPIVSRVNTNNGRSSVVYRSDFELSSFSSSSDGKRLALAGFVSDITKTSRLKSSRGVVIHPSDSLLNLTQDIAEGDVSAYRPVVQVFETSGGTKTVFEGSWNRLAWTGGESTMVSNVSMSPDGKHITFLARDSSVDVPESWKSGPVGVLLKATVRDELTKSLIINLPERFTETTKVSPRFVIPETPMISRPQWSDDSSEYLVRVRGRIGSDQRVDRNMTRSEANAIWNQLDLYSVDSRTGAKTLVTIADNVQSVIAFDRHATRIVVKVRCGDIISYKRSTASDGHKSTWVEEGRVKTIEAKAGNGPVTLTAANERYVISVEQSITVPPDLWAFDLRTGGRIRLTEINPQLKSQKLGRVEPIEWKGGYDKTYSGYLIYPLDYVAGKSYPAVFLMKNWNGSFVHTTDYWNTFPPQQLAVAGMVVLMVKGPSDLDVKSLDNETAETAMTLVEIDSIRSAKKELFARKLIDISKVGLMGFSHNCRIIKNAAMHSDAQNQPEWAAAMTVDGWSGDFVYYSTTGAGATAENGFEKSRYGGPPYGESRKSWEEFSNAENAGKVRTPILDDAHGPGDGSTGLLVSADWFTSMTVQGKPLEAIWFPGSDHILQKPLEREAEMQYAVDWFRFWLQGYERSNVVHDPERYARWRKLREQHAWNEKLISEGKDATAEFLKQRSGNLTSGVAKAPALTAGNQSAVTVAGKGN